MCENTYIDLFNQAFCQDNALVKDSVDYKCVSSSFDAGCNMLFV